MANNTNDNIIKLQKEKIQEILIYLDHIEQNNKDDENYLEQIKNAKNKIKEIEKNIGNIIYEENEKYIEIKNKTSHKIYSYTGPVYEYGNYVEDIKNIQTFAISKAKAKVNICSQIKKLRNRILNFPLSIDDTKILEIIDE